MHLFVCKSKFALIGRKKHQRTDINERPCATQLHLSGKNKLASIHPISSFDNDMLCVIALVIRRGVLPHRCLAIKPITGHKSVGRPFILPSTPHFFF